MSPKYSQVFSINSGRKLISFSLLFSSLILNQAALAAESKNSSSIDLDITGKSDSNIGQAQFRQDIVEDSIFNANLNYGYMIPLDRMQAVSLSAGIGAEQYQEVDTLNNVSANLGARFIWQNEIGFTAPLYQLSFNVQALDSETDQQDSTIFNTQFIINSRITDAISGTIGLSYKYRDSESTIYDLSDGRFFVSGDYALGKRGTVYATYSFIHGDIFSVLRPDKYEELFVALNVGDENIEPDDAFNEHFPSNVLDWQVYKLEADTQTLTMGYNYGLGSSMSLDFSALYIDVNASHDAEYYRKIISMSLLKRF